MELSVITSVAAFTLLAALCSTVFNKIKLPPLIGYIVAGIVITTVWTVPESGMEMVDVLSDIGLVMLMFCIGLEINLKKIRKQGLFAIGIVVIQLPIMMIGGIVGGSLLGFDMVQCICLGAILSGSSTAVVLAVLKNQNELDDDHKESLVLILIMEDIGQVTILSIITPIMATHDPSIDLNSLIVMIVSILAFMLFSIFVGLRVVPRTINWVSDNVSDEILTLLSVGLAFGMALLSVEIGLSMAIGAFLMGMMIAACRKSKEINHRVEPMRDLFMAMFFISIGMQITVSSLIENIGTVIVLYLIFLVLIVLAVFVAFWVLNDTARNGFLSAVSLATMGEFAFIIVEEAQGYGAVDPSFYTSVVGAALMSMVMLPFISRYAARIWDSATTKLPSPVMNACGRITSVRNDAYSKAQVTSRRSRKTMIRGMTHVYINILTVIAIQILFYFAIPAVVDWLCTNFGGTEPIWSYAMLAVNFVVLSIPVHHIVNNVRFLDSMVVSGARIASKRSREGKEPIRVFQGVLMMNSYILTFIIVALVILVSPNSVPLWQQLTVLGLAIAYVVAMYFRRMRGGGPDPEEAE